MAKTKIPIIAVTALAIIAIALTITTYAAITTSTNIPSSGGVSSSANLSVYANSACTIPLSSINWGTPTPGGGSAQTIYIKNNSNGVALNLNMTANDWSPQSVNGPIKITWNQEETVIQPGQSLTATLVLTVSPNIVGITTFSVQICITGTSAS